MRRPTGRGKDDSSAEACLELDISDYGTWSWRDTWGGRGARHGSLQSRHCREVPLHQSEWTEYSRATLSCQS